MALQPNLLLLFKQTVIFLAASENLEVFDSSDDS